MNHFGRIFIFIISFACSKSLETDVKHVIVDYDGNTTECFIDSMGYQYLYFIPQDSVDIDSMELKNIYYVFNDFNRVFHYSWSFEQNVKMIENRTGKLFTTSGDTIQFIDIHFNKDMIEPEVLVKTASDRSEFISLFNIEKIETDFSIMSESVKKGFYYSFYAFIAAVTFDIIKNWDEERRAIPQVWDQYNDLMPMISIIGFNAQEGTGAAYESFTSLVPSSILISMMYDIYKEKNKFYFNPIFKEKYFDRNMYVFSFKNIFNTMMRDIIYKVEKNKFGAKIVNLFR